MEESLKKTIGKIIESELPPLEDYRETQERKVQAKVVTEKGLPEIFEYLAEKIGKRVRVQSAVVGYEKTEPCFLQVQLYTPPYNMNTAIVKLTMKVNDYGGILFGYQVGRGEVEYFSAVDPLTEDLGSEIIRTIEGFLKRLGTFLNRVS